MTTVAALLEEGAAALSPAGIERPRFEARVLLEAATGASRAGLLAHPDRTVAACDAERFRGWLARRARREPLAYVLGRVEFWSLDFSVGPGVLVPRADSETLIQAVLAAFHDRSRPLRILDLGVGSGCLLLTLLHHFDLASGIGIDRSTAALAYAQRNAEALGVVARVELRVGDWIEDVDARFDVVVANPPYIPRGEIDTLQAEVSRHEPRGALDGGGDGLDAYRVILPALPALLGPGGAAFLEIGRGQEQALLPLATAIVGACRLHHDLAGVDRCLEIRPR